MSALEKAKALLRIDSPENYTLPEEVSESILSEVEAQYDLTPAESDAICAACEEWFVYEKGE